MADIVQEKIDKRFDELLKAYELYSRDRGLGESSEIPREDRIKIEIGRAIALSIADALRFEMKDLGAC